MWIKMSISVGIIAVFVVYIVAFLWMISNSYKSFSDEKRNYMAHRMRRIIEQDHINETEKVVVNTCVDTEHLL